MRAKLVSCLYAKPTNLALGRPTRQSSVYDNLGSEIAVDGDRSGDSYRKCSCTQQDPQGWWEVDMGRLVNLHEVKVPFIWRKNVTPAWGGLRACQRELLSHVFAPGAFFCFGGDEPEAKGEGG